MAERIIPSQGSDLYKESQTHCEKVECYIALSKVYQWNVNIFVKICMNQASCTPYSKRTLGVLKDSPVQVLFQVANTTLVLHEDIRPSVRQPKSNQASSNKHWRGHEDGYGLRDANKGTKNQVSQDCSQFTQSIAESKACSPPDSGEGFSSDHIQGVPGRDAQTIVKAQHENHHGLTSAEPKEETADAWKDHGAT